MRNKSILELPINNPSDVRFFFVKLMSDEGLNLHPDTPFASYYDHSREFRSAATFSSEEAKVLDAMMDKSFEVCEAAGTDIYEIALDLLN